MKLALLQQAARTTTGTQDWTDSSVLSDAIALILWGNDAAANATSTPNGKFYFGCTDLTNNIAFTMGEVDATAAGSHTTHGNASTANCYMRCAGGGTETMAMAYSSTLSNGVRVNYGTADGGAYLINGLLISGADIEVKVSSVLFGSGDTVKTVTHNCAGTPDAILMFTSGGQTAFDSAFGNMQATIGFFDGTNAAGLGIQDNATSNPTLNAARIAADFGHNIATNTDQYGYTLSAVGASTFTLTRGATNSIGAAAVFVCIRHKTGTAAAKAGLATLPTSGGNAALATGMAVAPQLLFTIPTRLTTTSLATDDSTGSFGLGIAVNNAGTTQQMAAAATIKDNVATTVAKSQVANATALLALDNTGAIRNAAAVASWDSGGVTLNHGTVGASAFEAMYLAFGIAAAAANSGLSDTGINSGIDARI